MKKCIAVFFSAILLLCAFLTPAGAAAPVDLSGMTFDELVALREQLNLAIWNSQEWQEVTVPEGIWIVGQDIPAGHWSVRVAAEHEYFYISVFDKLNEIERRPDQGASLMQQDIASPGYSPKESFLESTDVILLDGWYFKNNGAVIFTPYTGKPDLGFK